ncbi:Autophagy protein 5 [Capsicum annuum]|uniref:autophagy protein 5 isoform X3 n=1 Tax=Capsicum annuum TaxID=4072 RepID=UPI0007BFDC08|nr:autophagy protein 5 isoform X3 [Capsicum annuum]KAF3626533.1 Autophagy protein 5 [Capsicum annuum]
MGSKGGVGGSSAQKYIWEGAIPLQIHLHESEVTTLPPPAPALILAPRIGYLPLLAPKIKPFFSSSLPPGVDTIWFEYNGLPLKWYIPTGVLFDLLCAEPERPWNLTAAYIINGNCKNVMNMSQSDQLELWRSIMDGNLDTYLRISSKLKLVIVVDDFSIQLNISSPKSPESTQNADGTTPAKTGRIPVRLYVRAINEDFDELEAAPVVESWDNISYINRPVEIHGDGKCFTLYDAVVKLLPELFGEKLPPKDDVSKEEVEVGQKLSPEETIKSSTERSGEMLNEHIVSCCVSDGAEIKLLRIQGIEPKMEIPFAWVVNNLMNPEYFLHICVYVKIQEPITI